MQVLTLHPRLLVQSMAHGAQSPLSCAGMSLPAQHVEEAWQSAEFWGNKVLMEFRGTDAAHVTWVKQLKEVLMKLRAYVQKHHPTGPTWNAAGKPLATFAPSAAGEGRFCPESERASPCGL